LCIAEVELSFTEQLPGKASKKLQWAMHTAESYATTAPERGNLPMAQLNERPHWLSKPGYLAFGNLRSYSMGQLARLAQAVAEHVWPFQRAEVRVLVLQALHHVGTLHADKTTGRTEQVWRQGWLEPHGAAAALCQELARLGDELDQTPREHDSVLLLGEIAG
jgi:hypothetical protein